MITKEKAEQIIALAEGMTHAEWSRINHIVVTGFETQEAKLTFEPPKELYVYITSFNSSFRYVVIQSYDLFNGLV